MWNVSEACRIVGHRPNSVHSSLIHFESSLRECVGATDGNQWHVLREVRGADSSPRSDAFLERHCKVHIGRVSGFRRAPLHLRSGLALTMEAAAGYSWLWRCRLPPVVCYVRTPGTVGIAWRSSREV